MCCIRLLCWMDDSVFLDVCVCLSGCDFVCIFLSPFHFKQSQKMELLEKKSTILKQGILCFCLALRDSLSFLSFFLLWLDDDGRHWLLLQQRQSNDHRRPTDRRHYYSNPYNSHSCALGGEGEHPSLPLTQQVYMVKKAWPKFWNLPPP